MKDGFFRRNILLNEWSYFLARNTGLSIEEQEALSNSIFENFYSLDNHNFLFLRKGIDCISSINAIIDNSNLSSKINQDFLVQTFTVMSDLKIPEDLLSQILNNEKVALFIGSGVSKMLGLPLWGDLACRALEDLVKKGDINYYEKDKLECLEPKQVLSIYDSFYPKKSEEAQIFYRDNLSLKKEEEGGKLKNDDNPYIQLLKMDLLNITINIDDIFYKTTKRRDSEQMIERKGTRQEESRKAKKAFTQVFEGFSASLELNKNTIYQIHGSLKQIDKTVMTTKDYIQNYFSEGKFQEFLKRIFRDYTVIFIACGMSEFEMLKHCIDEKGENRKHYSLQPFYYNEVNVHRIRKKYFKTLKIELLPYFLDCNGHGRLLTVLQEWNNMIIAGKSKNPNYFEKLEKIDGAIAKNG